MSMLQQENAAGGIEDPTVQNKIKLGQTFKHNWVEERSVRPIDGEFKQFDTEKAKRGHKGLLSTEFDARADADTIYTTSYVPVEGDGLQSVGPRERLKKQYYYEKALEKVRSTVERPPSPPEYSTVMKKDFGIEGFEPSYAKPRQGHKMCEQPVTFWTEHLKKVPGVSQVKTEDTPFRKNTAFSKPISEHWDQAQPYDQENYPFM